ncbi:MAG: hypothetical protein A4S09_10160 [Proteobacteria bacterium SG_bin7]|nr:MAG: hypothetical protein A4S09_10160 [Proteobacteria bacterium SG_bin7]
MAQKQIRLLRFAILIILCFFRTVSAADLEIGTDGEEAHEYLIREAGFIRDACRANCDFNNQKFRYINWDDLQLLKNEKNLIGFAGRSSPYDLSNPTDKKEYDVTLRHILGILSGLDPRHDVIVGGATDTGFNSILFREAALAGFTTLGLTSLKGSEYKPAPMRYGYLDRGVSFGKESRTFAQVVNTVFALNGGNQTTREIVLAGHGYKKEVFVVDLGTPSVAVKVLSQDFPIYSTGTQAVQKYRDNLKKRFNGRSDVLARESNIIRPDLLKSFVRGKKVIGITSYSMMEPNAKLTEKNEKFSSDLLDRLNPNEVIIALSGSDLGAEAEFARVAKKKGFTVIALTAALSDPDQMLKNLDGIFVVAESWEGRVGEFIKLLDGLISFGGSQVVIDQILAAKTRAIPWVHIPDTVVLTDRYFFADEKTNFFTDGSLAGEFLLGGIKSGRGGSCQGLFFRL